MGGYLFGIFLGEGVISGGMSMGVICGYCISIAVLVSVYIILQGTINSAIVFCCVVDLMLIFCTS